MARPKKVISKSDRLNIRIDRQDTIRLEEIISKTGQSKSDIIREGIRMIHNISRYSQRTDEPYDDFDNGFTELNDDL